jgi:PII-like signaling protein
MESFRGEKVLMRIFIGESDKYGKIPLYKALVDLFRGHGCAGATVLRGVAGFGAHSVYHTDRLLRLSADLPMVVEVVESEDTLAAMMPQLSEMMNGGMITTEKVQVVYYAPKPVTS